MRQVQDHVTIAIKALAEELQKNREAINKVIITNNNVLDELRAIKNIHKGMMFVLKKMSGFMADTPDLLEGIVGLATETKLMVIELQDIINKLYNNK